MSEFFVNLITSKLGTVVLCIICFWGGVKITTNDYEYKIAALKQQIAEQSQEIEQQVILQNKEIQQSQMQINYEAYSLKQKAEENFNEIVRQLRETFSDFNGFDDDNGVPESTGSDNRQQMPDNPGTPAAVADCPPCKPCKQNACNTKQHERAYLKLSEQLIEQAHECDQLANDYNQLLKLYNTTKQTYNSN